MFFFVCFFLTTTTPEQTFYQSQTDCLKIWQENLSTRVDKQLLLAPLYPNCWLMSNLGDLRVYSWANSKLLSSLALQYAGGAMGWIMFQGGDQRGETPPPGAKPLKSEACQRWQLSKLCRVDSSYTNWRGEFENCWNFHVIRSAEDPKHCISLFLNQSHYWKIIIYREGTSWTSYREQGDMKN